MLGPLREDSPRRIGPYGVRARLGAGGMGEVFLGVHDGGGEPVAVKTVRRDVARDPGFRSRFRREITVARSVSGPHLALLLDGDADAEVPWLATGYVAGPTLSAAVRRAGAMDEAEVRMLGAGLARALAAVHAAGIVHRDVKPGNVMLAADGPSLIDFGIARDSGATPLTTTSRMVGSPAFMSPEHVAGSGRVVPASDVFCLASVLCYAVTGRDPFGDGPVAAVLYRVKYVEADLDDVPDALRAVLERCLVADPAARPAAAELAELLDPGAAGRWPDPVAQHIAEHERELARVVALGGPLLPGYTPTEATADSRPELHQLPTQGTDFTPGLHIAPTQGPGLAPPPRRSRRALAVSLAALIVLGAATGGILAWRNKGGEPGGTARGGGSPAARIVAGIDENGGPDASGTVPYGRDVRPHGVEEVLEGEVLRGTGRLFRGSGRRGLPEGGRHVRGVVGRRRAPDVDARLRRDRTDRGLRAPRPVLHAGPTPPDRPCTTTPSSSLWATGCSHWTPGPARSAGRPGRAARTIWTVRRSSSTAWSSPPPQRLPRERSLPRTT